MLGGDIVKFSKINGTIVVILARLVLRDQVDLAISFVTQREVLELSLEVWAARIQVSALGA